MKRSTVSCQSRWRRSCSAVKWYPREFGLEPRIRAAKTVALQLPKEIAYLLVRRDSILTIPKFLAHQFLVDKALGCLAHGRGTLVERLMIQEAGDAKFPIDVAGLDDAIAHDDRDAIHHDRAAEDACEEEDREW